MMRLIQGMATSLFAGAVCFGLMVPASAQDLGGIKGTFILKGDIPELPPLVKKGENVKDSGICAVADVPDQSVVVDKDTKGLANVFIWIGRFRERDIPDKLKTPAESEIVADQKGCVFIPHAMVARTGQTLKMINSDPVAHNFHVNAIRGDAFNPLIAANDQQGVKHEFKKADVLPVPVTCDIHPWMKANLLVLDHPYGAASNEKGEFEIADIPPGKYDFKVWQESVGYVRGLDVEDVEIEAGKTIDLGKLEVQLK